MATFGSLRRSQARFETFRVDLSSGELLREGVRVPIQDQPFQILRLLLEAEGRVVTREQLRSALWTQDTFVDFEHGVNTAVKKLRQALEDSADVPKFVETLPKIGYRFIVPVEWMADARVAARTSRVVPIAPAGPTAVPPFSPGKLRPWTTIWRWQFALLAAGLLILSTAGYHVLRSRPQTQPDKLTVVPFTTFPGFEIGPSFSPDGNQIVFAWFGYEKEFQFDLYIKQVGEERVVQLTHHPATFLGSAWSPDGRVIAFMRYVDGDPRASGIFVISPLGGAEHKLTDISTFGSWEPIAVSWSADSKWVAFPKVSSPEKKTESASEHFDIHMVNVESAEERVLPDPSPDCINMWQPAFSPDGKYLASVCALTEGVARIYLQTPDGKNSRKIVETWSSEGFSGLAWTADSHSLLYSPDHHLWRVSLAGGKPEKLLFAQAVESVAIARAGNRLAYAQVRHPGNIWKLELASQRKSAGPAAKLISSSRGDAGPHVSPDGARIAFQSWRSGSPEVWMCDRDASNPVQLTSFGGPPIGTPAWSPDSRRLVFDVRASGNPELYTVDVDGGPPRRFPTTTANASNPFWSADGRWIYFNTEHPDAIWKAPVDVDGGFAKPEKTEKEKQNRSAIRLTEGASQTVPQESADGSRVFVYRVEGTHVQPWSASVNGGDEHPVVGMPPDVPWTSASRGIYFLNGSPRHFSLNYFEFATKDIHKVADLPGLFSIWGPHLSPDAHTFLFTGIEHSEGDIVLVEGFR